MVWLGWLWVDRGGVLEGGELLLLLLKERPPPLDLASASSTKAGTARIHANNRAVRETIIWVFVRCIILSPFKFPHWDRIDWTGTPIS